MWITQINVFKGVWTGLVEAALLLLFSLSLLASNCWLLCTVYAHRKNHLVLFKCLLVMHCMRWSTVTANAWLSTGAAKYANCMWSRQCMFIWTTTFPCRTLPTIVMGEPHVYCTTSFKLSNSLFGDSAYCEYIPQGFWHSSQLIVHVGRRHCPSSIAGGAPLACRSLCLSNDGQQLSVVLWPFSCSNGKKWPGLSGWGSGRKYSFVKHSTLETPCLHGRSPHLHTCEKNIHIFVCYKCATKFMDLKGNCIQKLTI